MKPYVCVAVIVLASPLIFGFAKAHAQSISAPASPPTVASRPAMSSTPSPAAKLGALMTVARAQANPPSQADAAPPAVRIEAARSEPVRSPPSQRRSGSSVLASNEVR